MSARYRTPGTNTWRGGTIIQTRRGEHDVWYYIRDNKTGVVEPVPWYRVQKEA